MGMMNSRANSGRCGWALALVLFTAVTGTAEDWQDWKRSQKIVIDAASVGVDLSSDLEGFPLLVRLSSSTTPDLDFGSDKHSLRFATLAGKELPYQIESWDQANGRAEIWVRVDLRAGSQEHAVLMLWSNPSAAAGDGSGVFTAADGFRGVWHLDDSPSGQFADASAEGRHGTSYVTSTGKLGVIGKGQQFTKENGDYIEVAEPEARTMAAFTLSAWVRQDRVYRDWDDSDDERKQQWILGSRRWWPPSGHELLSLGTQICASAHTTDGSKWFYRQGAFNKANQWYHAAVTWSAASEELTFYINGVVHDSAAQLSADQIICAAGAPFRISTPKTQSSNCGYNGYIDEAREETVARSAQWIRLSYENQKPGSTLLDFSGAYLPLTGGRMLGEIDMGPHRLKSTRGEDVAFVQFGADEEDGLAVQVQAGGSASGRGGDIALLPGKGGSATENGVVHVGTESNEHDLIVHGKLKIKKWTMEETPDYVFEPEYQLLTLDELEAYVRANRHLPHVPSAKEMAEEGVDPTAMNMALLRHIEEITLRLIAQQKRIDALEDALENRR